MLSAALLPALLALVPEIAPLHRTVDLKVNESAQVEFAGGMKATVKLLAISSVADSLRGAVREAGVEIEIEGARLKLSCGNYQLPVKTGRVQVDCPLNRILLANSNRNPWGLVKDARLRLWPADSPFLQPGTFVYPIRQKWFVGDTQMANEPTFQTGDERPSRRAIYYHYALDIGGAEGMTDVVAATDGVVVARGTESVPGYEKTPVNPRYDRVFVMDGRGWIYGYVHLLSIDPGIRLGERVGMGQKIGVLGKEGTSGGWSHLHFEIHGHQPSGEWGIEEGYAFLWEAYLREYQPSLIAVARPHRLVGVGEKVVLDGAKSWCRQGRIARYEWMFVDGSKASGPRVERTYKQPGTYHVTLKVTGDSGQVAYDFAFVQVLERPVANSPQIDQAPPTIHAVYSPTMNLRPGQPITFLVRSFRTTSGAETWDFGDGSPSVTVKSDGGVVPLARDGYVKTVHSYRKPGGYLVRVERSNERGEKAVAHLHVQVQ